MQGWAGAGWGAQFIPRVGMEVVVAFEAGNPDRPLVLGALYNGVTRPPFALPEQKTRSGWRSHSTPRTEGFNELSFEDAAGREQLYLHASRDLDALVERNRTATIRNDDHTEVQRNQTVVVRAAQTTQVIGARTTEVDAEDRVDVRGSRSVSVQRELPRV